MKSPNKNTIYHLSNQKKFPVQIKCLSKRETEKEVGMGEIVIWGKQERGLLWAN